MFDDCLRHAKLWADKYSLPDEKPGKKPREKRKTATPSLF